ncbi:MAG: tryptophan synthase subunit alpha [Planctomycetes bacterium]|nr:tryptophan synthase subunit alpha [Planctomycetota bacterium]
MMDRENRIETRLAERVSGACGAFLPYLTAGFPDVDATVALIRHADSLGAAVVELGFPFSDSIADGPVIQDSFHYVLETGHKLADTFRLVSEVRKSVACGLVAMVSFSIVHRFGVDAFFAQSAAVGFDGVILPDVPVEESCETAAAVTRAGLCHIGLVAPTTSPERRTAIARNSTGFVYQIAVAGTTGERARLADELPQSVAELRRVSGLPVCVGFGVSSADHVRQVCRYADGAIVGSAIIRRIEDALRAGLPGDELIRNVAGFLDELAAGLVDES